MNGFSVRAPTSRPLSSPIALAASRDTTTIGTTPMSAFTHSLTTMPVIVITATGDRSSPPLITTTVAKAAAMPTTATASVMFSRFWMRQKYSDAKPR